MLIVLDFEKDENSQQINCDPRKGIKPKTLCI